MPFSKLSVPLVAGFALVSLMAGWAVGAATTDAPQKTVRVIARSFEFVPSEIVLRKGEPVTLEIMPAEVLMGFSAPELKLRADLPPGAPVRLSFTPERSGSFAFRCSIFCGDGHRKMKGTITVLDAPSS